MRYSVYLLYYQHKVQMLTPEELQRVLGVSKEINGLLRFYTES